MAFGTRDRRGIICEGVCLMLTSITLALAISYAYQLWYAPVSADVAGDGLSRGSLIFTYGLPPVVGILVHLISVGLNFARMASNLYCVLFSGILSLGWLVTTVIWGHCQRESGHNPDFPWPAVCYQLKIDINTSNNFYRGVSKATGDALIALAVLVVVAQVLY